jgi:ADP-dependent NAD(P)H-hydrate dehydratase / NAD(P)H-hydrate epimerase
MTHHSPRAKSSSASGRPTESIELSQFYPVRKRQGRKGDYGRVIVAGGSERYSGCLAFNALAALRAGADLAIIIAPRRAADIVASYSPDLITIPCDKPYPDPKLVDEQVSKADSMVVGCGVQRTTSAHKALTLILRESQIPTVVDAEALHALASRKLSVRGKRFLLTPNAGEFQVLTGRPWPESRDERVPSIRALAKKYDSTAIVKGAEDFISDGQRVAIDFAGSAYMTKGGYGDLLAGVAGAVLARGFDPFDSARVAAYIVGRAGEISSSKLGEGTLASDALSEIPAIITNG